MTTLYGSIGQEKIRAVLQSLYDKLFDDPIVGFLFEGKDKKHIVEQQVVFTSRFLGGCAHVYAGKPLPEAHEHLPLLPGHFDRRHHLLEQTLDAHGVPDDVKREWLRIDESLRASVLKPGKEARDKTRQPA